MNGRFPDKTGKTVTAEDRSARFHINRQLLLLLLLQQPVGYRQRRLIMSRRRRRCRRREDEGAQEEITPASPPSSPHFFKIILSHTLESGKLGIPKSFLRRFAKDLSSSVLLKVSGGSTWPVKLEKSSNDMVWLCEGWRKFTEYYSIGHGHLIVFGYEGNSVFHVMIFDKSALEIDYPLSIGSDMEIEDSEGFMPCSWPSSNGSPRVFGGQRPLTALELASKFESEHPFFKVVIRPTYVNKYLGIPCEFFRKYLRKDKKIVTLKCSDRSWQLKLRNYEHRDMAVLSSGWSSFAREMGLHGRDVCVFELIDRDEIVFSVSIFTSDGPIKINRSQCRQASSELAFHVPPCPNPVSAHEKASQFESEYPFFYVVLLPIHIKEKYVTVPWEFIRTYIREGQRMVTLVYSGQSWEVKLRGYQRSRIASLGAGWSAFARAACLRKGDVCVFELVERDDIAFRVSIFSGADKEVICID